MRKTILAEMQKVKSQIIYFFIKKESISKDGVNLPKENLTSKNKLNEMMKV